MDEGKATRPKPKWWSRPRGGDSPRPGVSSSEAHAPDPGTPATTTAAAETAAPAEPAGNGTRGGTAAGSVRPLHAEDPYRTPPYGGPGPWAPAPPVQRPPGSTPAHGVSVPPSGTTTPPHGVSVPSAGATPPHGVQPPSSGTGATRPGATPSVPPAGATPPHGVALPPGGGQTAGGGPAQPTPAAPPTASPRYDPWAVPVAVPAPVPPGKRRGSGRLLVGALLLALVAGGLGGLAGAYVQRNGGFHEVELPQAPAEQSSHRAPGSVAGIAEAVLPGVVTLHVSGSDGGATGTGFVLDDRGHILTNDHVVRPAEDGGDIQVAFHDGGTAEAEVIGTDSGYDLAVVKVDGVSGLHPLSLGNSDSVRVGDPVIAIGAPFDLEGTVTTGIISATERPITAGGEQGASDVSYVDALQTDASINPGNSGGPLVDAEGRVIGVNSAIKAGGGGSGVPGERQGGSIGLGFAIPVNQAKRVAEELINTGRATHPVLGVTLDMSYRGEGARVMRKDRGSAPVTPGSPADEAGVEPGDVITELGGERVHSGEELIVKVRSHRPGDELRLTLRREGEVESLRLTLGSSDGG